MKHDFLLHLAVICYGIEYTEENNLICLSDGLGEKLINICFVNGWGKLLMVKYLSIYKGQLIH